MAKTLILAHELLNKYGTRPYLPLEYPRTGDSSKTYNIPSAINIVAHLIPCESQDVSVRHMDSNHRYSYGVLQIQAETWVRWSKKSGIVGTPMNPEDAIRMGIWAVQNGYVGEWSCYKILTK